MEGWVGLGGWLRSESVYRFTHPTTNLARCRANCVDRDQRVIATPNRQTVPVLWWCCCLGALYLSRDLHTTLSVGQSVIIGQTRRCWLTWHWPQRTPHTAAVQLTQQQQQRRRRRHDAWRLACGSLARRHRLTNRSTLHGTDRRCITTPRDVTAAAVAVLQTA